MIWMLFSGLWSVHVLLRWSLACWLLQGRDQEYSSSEGGNNTFRMRFWCVWWSMYLILEPVQPSVLEENIESLPSPKSLLCVSPWALMSLLKKQFKSLLLTKIQSSQFFSLLIKKYVQCRLMIQFCIHHKTGIGNSSEKLKPTGCVIKEMYSE